MIIIFSLFSFGAAIINLISSIRFYFRYQKDKVEASKNYSLAALLVFWAFFLITFPQLILFEPFLIQIDFIFIDILLLVAILCWEISMLELTNLSHYKKIFSLMIFSGLLIYIFLNIFFFSPAQPLISDGKIYYWTSGTPWLQSIIRTLLVMGALIIAVTYFKWMRDFQEKGEKILFWRSFVIGLGPLLVGIAGFIFWFFPLFYFTPFILNLSAFIGFLGFLTSFVVGAAIFPSPQEKFVKKIT